MRGMVLVGSQEAPMDLAQRARAYLACIEQARSFDALAPFLHPDVLLVEHPNRLLAQGKTRRFTDVRVAFEAGRKAVSASATAFARW